MFMVLAGHLMTYKLKKLQFESPISQTDPSLQSMFDDYKRFVASGGGYKKSVTARENPFLLFH